MKLQARTDKMVPLNHSIWLVSFIFLLNIATWHWNRRPRGNGAKLKFKPISHFLSDSSVFSSTCEFGLQAKPGWLAMPLSYMECFSHKPLNSSCWLKNKFAKLLFHFYPNIESAIESVVTYNMSFFSSIYVLKRIEISCVIQSKFLDSLNYLKTANSYYK